MDWTELSNRLADGAKVYKAFQDGANAASMLAGFERAHSELSAQYEVLTAQIAQAKADLQTAQAEVAHTRIVANQDLVRKQADWEAAHTKQVVAADDEAAAWREKLADQAKTFQTQAQWYQTQIDQWEGALAKLQGQVASLEQIKASLKSQLQGVA